MEGRFTRTLNRLLVTLKVEEVPHIKRIIVTVVGGTVLIFGAALVFLPGPGLLVILGGMAILGTEYAWARRWLRKGRLMAKQALSRTQKIIHSASSSESKAARKEKAADEIPAAERGEEPASELAGAACGRPPDETISSR